MNNLQEFINSLNIPYKGTILNNRYILNLNSSNEFSTVFNIISLNDELTSEEGSIATDSATEFRYTNGIFEIDLKADYNNNIYSIVIERK